MHLYKFSQVAFLWLMTCIFSVDDLHFLVDDLHFLVDGLHFFVNDKNFVAYISISLQVRPDLKEETFYEILNITTILVHYWNY